MRSFYLLSLLGVVTVAATVSGCFSPVRPRSVPTSPASRPGAGPTAAVPVVPEDAAGRVALARSLLGSRYRYGGATPRGFDCSGFARYVFARDGHELPRTAAEQAESGRWVPLDELQPGDLVFFSDVGSKPHHVGLIVSGPGQPLRMIHASTSQGVVETGIFEGTYWLRRLRFGRRLEPATSTSHN